MRLKKSIFIIITIAASIICIPLIAYNVFSSSGTIAENEIQTIDFQNGDLIFRRGRSLESFAVYLADTDRDFSHIGVVIIENKKTYVVHATPGEESGKIERVRKDPLEHFLAKKRASHFAVYRAKKINNDIKKSIAKVATSFYEDKLLFDDKYDLLSDEKLYCSELVLKAYQKSGIPLSGMKEEAFDFVLGEINVLFPSAFIKNKTFSKIYSN